MESSDKNNVKSSGVNPFSVVTFADHLFRQKPITTEEDWLLLNTALIEDMGAELWLEELLDVLSLSRAQYDGHDAINPSMVVTISESLKGQHEPAITPQQWKQTNTKLIKELGPYKWLLQLLQALQIGNVPA